LLEEEAIQSFLKHRVLGRYTIAFTQKLARSAPVTLVDGYAGNGRDESGKPGSAELLLMAAAAAPSGSTQVELVEKDDKTRSELLQVVGHYPSSLARVSGGTVESNLPEILSRAQRRALFLFLDPCGAGLTFQQVCLLAQRAPSWPPTEILLNFNGDLGRRVAANAITRETSSVLDMVCGSWWRESIQRGRSKSTASWETALHELVYDYVEQLAAAIPDSSVMAIPVRKRPTGQPVFYLVHITRSPHGTWVMSDAVARSMREWRSESEVLDLKGQASLFEPVDVLADYQDARERIARNLTTISQGPSAGLELRLVASQVLDGAIGVLSDTEINQIARDLNDAQVLRLAKKGKGTRTYAVYPVAATGI